MSNGDAVKPTSERRISLAFRGIGRQDVAGSSCTVGVLKHSNGDCCCVAGYFGIFSTIPLFPRRAAEGSRLGLRSLVRIRRVSEVTGVSGCPVEATSMSGGMPGGLVACCRVRDLPSFPILSVLLASPALSSRLPRSQVATPHLAATVSPHTGNPLPLLVRFGGASSA